MTSSAHRSLAVAIIDDDAAIRDAISSYLSLEGHLVSVFADSGQFLQAASNLRIDIALIDLVMPGMDGLELLQRLGPTPGFCTVMMSANGDISSAVKALKLGAYDFLEKPIKPQDLSDFLQAAVAARSCAQKLNLPQIHFDELSPREQDVLRLLAEGQTNKEIARILDLSPRTVEAHRAKIFAKLEVRNIAELIRLYFIANPAIG